VSCPLLVAAVFAMIGYIFRKWDMISHVISPTFIGNLFDDPFRIYIDERLSSLLSRGFLRPFVLREEFSLISFGSGNSVLGHLNRSLSGDDNLNHPRIGTHQLGRVIEGRHVGHQHGGRARYPGWRNDRGAGHRGSTHQEPPQEKNWCQIL